MTILVAFDISMVILIVVIGAWTVFVRNAFASIVGFVVYGLLLSVAWVRLSAVDVALTEAAIGGGMTGMLLLGAVARLRVAKPSAPKVSSLMRLTGGVCCVLVSVAIAIGVLVPPEHIPSLAPAVMAKLPQSGLANPVAGVLFVYRALDTLLEKIVLLLALLGVWSLAPDRLWGGVPGLRIHAQPNGSLPFLAQLLPPIGIVVGIYMCWVGATAPGGAFQGGTILAAMWLLIMIAGLQNVPSIDQRRLRLSLIIGPLLFVIVGVAGLVVAGNFLAYPAGYEKPVIVAVELALTISIGATLCMLAAGPPARVPPP